jgi:hypothetical protein
MTPPTPTVKQQAPTLKRGTGRAVTFSAGGSQTSERAGTGMEAMGCLSGWKRHQHSMWEQLSRRLLVVLGSGKRGDGNSNSRNSSCHSISIDGSVKLQAFIRDGSNVHHAVSG